MHKWSLRHMQTEKELVRLHILCAVSPVLSLFAHINKGQRTASDFQRDLQQQWLVLHENVDVWSQTKTKGPFLSMTTNQMKPKEVAHKATLVSFIVRKLHQCLMFTQIWKNYNKSTWIAKKYFPILTQVTFHRKEKQILHTFTKHVKKHVWLTDRSGRKIHCKSEIQYKFDLND